MPRPNASVGYVFNSPPGLTFSVDWRVLREPPPPQQFYYHSSFWIDAPGGFAATGSYGRGAYFGPQRLAGGRRCVIFSIWDDAARPTAGVARPLVRGPNDKRNPDNGWGAHTEAPIQWTVGVAYRMTITHVPAMGLWLCACTDLATAKAKPVLVGAIEAEGSLAGWCMTHYETLGGSEYCTGHGPAAVTWENWSPPTTPQVPFWEGTCPAVLKVAQMGEATAFVLR